MRDSTAIAKCAGPLGCALLLAAAVGCQGELEPVARVAVEPPALTLTYPGTAEIHTIWEATAPLDELGAPPVVFVHLLDADGEVARTFDHPFPDAWRPGTPMSDSIAVWQSALAPPLAPGAYRLSLGIWDPVTRRRWPLAVDGVELGRYEYVVASVEVPPVPRSAPALAFTGDWLSVEPTGDHQTLAHRWATGPARLELTGLTGPLAVGLRLAAPTGDGESERLVLDEGAERAELTLSSDCSEEVLRIEPTRRSDLELMLRPPEGVSRCAVDLVPNFAVLDVGSPARRVVRLEMLTWNEVSG